jgi:radical SAM-linked protein
MDSWYDSVERAFNAWSQAIAEANLSWKYRKVENGEWNVMEYQNPDTLLKIPLPWDHIDTGIEKKWLAVDLQRALEAATVPDCSFAECSHCGVCSTDFGHNIVIKPIECPPFDGEFVPNTNKLQRLRVWFGKLGDMALVSHLDLMRLIDRVVRRASLPVAFTGGFHPLPRISLASALPLGATSSGEIVDFEMSQPLSVEDFKTRLSNSLPSDIPIYNVVEINLKAPAAAAQLETAEYIITVATDHEASEATWQQAVDTIKAKTEIWYEQTTKSGKLQQINLRSRLLNLELIDTRAGENVVKLQYVGSCRNDGMLLRPEHVLFMLEQVAENEYHLLHIHRVGLGLHS